MKSPVPYEKLSKKQKRESDKRRRGGWGELNPVTRKSANKKLYNRKRTGARYEIEAAGSFCLPVNNMRPESVETLLLKWGEVSGRGE